MSSKPAKDDQPATMTLADMMKWEAQLPEKIKLMRMFNALENIEILATLYGEDATFERGELRLECLKEIVKLSREARHGL